MTLTRNIRPQRLLITVTLMQQTAQQWEHLLHTTGGALNLNKCYWYGIAWTFTPAGEPKMTTGMMTATPYTSHPATVTASLHPSNASATTVADAPLVCALHPMAATMMNSFTAYNRPRKCVIASKQHPLDESTLA